MMAKSRKVPIRKKKQRTHETAHRRAMADSKVRKQVSILQRGWASMGLLERGERLRELTGLGCSTRGLEEELHQSATTIRRNISLATLPEVDRKAIEAGKSAKKTLEQKARDEGQRRRQQRIIEDRETGALSDEVANVILEFCRAKNGRSKVSVFGASAEELINETRWALHLSEAAGYRLTKVSKRKGVGGLFNKTRPPNMEDAVWMPHHAEWLANIVWTIAPERPIWESALEKAERRIGELKPKKTPTEMIQDRIRHLQWVSTSTFRPMYYGARNHMKRQGKPTPPAKPAKRVS